MRVSSLSDSRVIELVSRYFVPAWASRDDYQLAADRAEHDELLRIDRSIEGTKFRGGHVCVYVLDPAGKVLGTQRVQLATDPKNLIGFLEDIVEAQKLKPRDPDAVRASAAPPRTRPPRTKDGLLLHVWVRFLGNRADYGLSQDWVELKPAEWAGFAPPAGTRAGDTWRVPAKAAGKLARFFYPPAPDWKAQDSEVEEAALTATAAAVTDAETDVRLRGTVVLSHPFGDKDTPGKVTAKLLGVARYDHAKRAFTSFALVSEEARYVWHWQGKPGGEKMVIAVDREP